MAKSTKRFDSIYTDSSIQLPKKEEGNLLYYIMMALFVIALGASIIFVGGMLRFTMAIFILFIVGFNLVYWTIEKTDKSDIWRKEDEFDEEINLKLRETSNLVRRAFEGMELSQGLLEKKLRNLYLEKLMEKRNLSHKEVRKLLDNPDEFRKVVDDEIISDFVLLKKEEEDEEKVDDREDEHPSPEKFEKEDYEEWISELLEHIERWE